MESILTETVEAQLENLMDSLEDLGFILQSPANNETVCDLYWNMISAGVSSQQFRDLVEQLHTQGMQYQKITSVQSENKKLDINNEEKFYGDIVDYVNTQGLNITKFSKEERTFEHNAILLESLVSELQVARMLAARGSVSNNNNNESAMQVEKSTFWISDLIHECCGTLGVPVSADNAVSLHQISVKLKNHLGSLPKNYLGELLLHSSLNNSQTKTLQEINEALKQDYEQRKKMMIKRVDVTIQTFLWSPKGEANQTEIKSIIQNKYEQMTSFTHITLFDVFAARSSLTEIVKTSSKQVAKQTKSSLKTLVIGQVPDRGGRLNENRVSVTVFEESKGPKPQRDKERVQGSWQGNKGNRGKQDRRGFSDGWEGQKRGRNKQQFY